MSEIKALEKVRTIARNMAKGRNLENHEECNVLLITANELEAEIAERFIELPVDADGVPIHVGDYLHSDETGRDFPCRGYSYGLNGNTPRWTIECCYDPYSGTSEFVSAKSCRHAKPRTVEDVLRDMVRLAEDTSNGRLDDGDIEGFADEIRELMGGAE